MKRLKTLILFDVGGIQIELDFNNFYKTLSVFSKTINQEDIKNSYLDSGLEKLILSGKINEREYSEKLSEIINHKISEKELEEIIPSSWKVPINPVIALKKRLYNSGYSIGIFSNTFELAVKIASRKYPEVFETYDDSFPKILSYKIGSIKPEPRIYKEVKKYRDKDKIILIDDNEVNVKTGIEKFRWLGIHFTGNIDVSEPVRVLHSNFSKETAGFKTADSPEELVKSLQEFGVKL